MPTVYGSPPRATVQENEVENPPESNPGSKSIQTDTSTSDQSQNFSVVKSNRVAKSDGVSKPSGLRPSLHLQIEETMGEKSSNSITSNTYQYQKKKIFCC